MVLPHVDMRGAEAILDKLRWSTDTELSPVGNSRNVTPLGHNVHAASVLIYIGGIKSITPTDTLTFLCTSNEINLARRSSTSIGTIL